MINYDVTNKKNWSALFSNLDNNLLRLFPGGKIQTVQLPTLSYAAPPDESRQLILAKKIQKYLMEEFADERVRVVRKTTKWALSAEAALKLVLIDFENNVKLSRQSKLGEANKNPDIDPKLG